MDRVKNAEMLKQAQEELAGQFRKIRQAQVRVAILQKQIKGYEALEEAFELESHQNFDALPICFMDEIGLTDACMNIVRCSNNPLTTIEIRDRLMAFGYSLDVYSNPMATLHVTLERLARSGRLKMDLNSESKKVFSIPAKRRSRMAEAFAKARKTTFDEKMRRFGDAVKAK